LALEQQRRRLIVTFSKQTQLLCLRTTFRAQYARTHPIR
jgi:ATP phosphoribosyltransferase regulatory subunit HisZ